MNKNLKAKIKESLTSVLPITIIVLVLHFTITPLSGGTLALFLVGAFFLIVGMGLFTLGADLSMMPMGETIGSELTKSRKLLLLIVVAFVMGMFITIAEPDLQVLAEQVSSIPNMTLILTVAVGVGLFLVLALLRIVFQKSLRVLLIICYAAIFIIAAFASDSFLAVAFDSGGVTTGPITVPFILALGIGVAAVRGGKSSQDDSFGLVAICSIGPILAVLLLDMFFRNSGATYAEVAPTEINSVVELFEAFGHGFPEYFKEVGIALSPIIIFFAIFQIFVLKLPKTQIIKMIVGIGYTYIGLVLFLTGVNVGFLPIGNYIGAQIGSLDYNWILIPLGAVMGFFVVMAEPAVHVLNKQVEEITVGAITKRSMLMSLSIGVAISIGLSMIRVVTGLSIWWFILPGYGIALALTFFVPRVFTAIAFDSGGVASGPMTATFLLPFAMGACASVGGNIMTDAFGLVAMVAMTPLITIQGLGLVYKIKLKREEGLEKPEGGLVPVLDEEDEEIIDL
ncbi:DUF1538 domain-containing protein [Christensenellaceae bacterium OttesenSCG-928-K19]|nr:DUF1538 domain-containing protein [Christensenellaceae bacterium OttesenSCG-928-K19]